jgi:hypothetical protein
MDRGLVADSGAASARVVIERAIEAFRALGELGESVSDEWQYVNDLVAVHAADLRSLIEADPERVLPAATVRAVDVAIEEIRLIRDGHRAIDWLSTFPQIVRVALVAPVRAA